MAPTSTTGPLSPADKAALRASYAQIKKQRLQGAQRTLIMSARAALKRALAEERRRAQWLDHF